MRVLIDDAGVYHILKPRNLCDELGLYEERCFVLVWSRDEGGEEADVYCAAVEDDN